MDSVAEQDSMHVRPMRHTVECGYEEATPVWDDRVGPRLLSNELACAQLEFLGYLASSGMIIG